MVGERKIGRETGGGRERDSHIEGEERQGWEKDKQGDMSGSRRGRRQGWERERWKERQEREKKERKGDRDGREKDRDTGAGERERGRETGVGERERGEKEKKITNTNKFMELYIVVFHSAERSEALQSGYQRQGGKEKDRKRDGLGERKI